MLSGPMVTDHFPPPRREQIPIARVGSAAPLSLKESPVGITQRKVFAHAEMLVFMITLDYQMTSFNQFFSCYLSSDQVVRLSAGVLWVLPVALIWVVVEEEAFQVPFLVWLDHQAHLAVGAHLAAVGLAGLVLWVDLAGLVVRWVGLVDIYLVLVWGCQCSLSTDLLLLCNSKGEMGWGRWCGALLTFLDHAWVPQWLKRVSLEAVMDYRLGWVWETYHIAGAAVGAAAVEWEVDLCDRRMDPQWGYCPSQDLKDDLME
eukprot:Rmarinus@m.11948